MNKEQSLNVELLVTNYFIPLEFHQFNFNEGYLAIFQLRFLDFVVKFHEFKQAFIIELLKEFLIELIQEFLIKLLR